SRGFHTGFSAVIASCASPGVTPASTSRPISVSPVPTRTTRASATAGTGSAGAVGVTIAAMAGVGAGAGAAGAWAPGARTMLTNSSAAAAATGGRGKITRILSLSSSVLVRRARRRCVSLPQGRHRRRVSLCQPLVPPRPEPFVSAIGSTEIVNGIWRQPEKALSLMSISGRRQAGDQAVSVPALAAGESLLTSVGAGLISPAPSVAGDVL